MEIVERAGDAPIYALFPWFSDNGSHHFYPDDLSAAIALKPFSKLFVVAGRKGNHVALDCGASRQRVRPELVQEVTVNAARFFRIGEPVTVRKTGQTALIRSMTWHHKRREMMVGLEIEGKASSRRFWLRDLVPSNGQT